jgi:hypothetical protein
MARKRSKVLERRQYIICLFRRGDCRDEGHNPEKFFLGSRPGEDITCSVFTVCDAVKTKV